MTTATLESSIIRNSNSVDSNISIRTINSSSNILRQWVSRVNAFSGEYNDSTWGANCVIGAPRVYPNYGDLNYAWAQNSDFHPNHFIEVEYDEEVYVTCINIYETYHAGSIIRIKLKDSANDTWKVVWESAVGAMNIETSRIFSPELKKVFFKSKHVRLDIDCTASNSFCEIDAIELIGKKFHIDPVSVEKILSSNLKKLLLSEEFSDVQFNVSGKLFKAHRNILTVRSDFFRAMICENLKEDRLARAINIENVTINGFKALLNYLYTNEIDDDTELTVACELIRLSEWYSLDDLRSTAFSFIKRQLDLENVVDLLICATTLDPKLEDCESICLKFIAKNFTQLYNRSDFKNLPRYILVKIAQYYAKFQDAN